MPFILSEAGLRPLPRGYELPMGYLGRGYQAGKEHQIYIRRTPDDQADSENGEKWVFEI